MAAYTPPSSMADPDIIGENHYPYAPQIHYFPRTGYWAARVVNVSLSPPLEVERAHCKWEWSARRWARRRARALNAVAERGTAKGWHW